MTHADAFARRRAAAVCAVDLLEDGQRVHVRPQRHTGLPTGADGGDNPDPRKRVLVGNGGVGSISGVK